jgi:hypothetical protein
MMTLSTMISQPVWILVGLIGLADILIFLWCIILICRNRSQQGRHSAQDEFALLPEQTKPPALFQQSLTCMQIDAVFDGLVALVETERVKLKSMIHPVTGPATDEPVGMHDGHKGANVTEDSFSQRQAPELPLDQQIARFAASGKKPTAIASQLGISLAEVTLAMRMMAGEPSPSGRKLEAVA